MAGGRKYVIGGNWKCNGTKQSVRDLIDILNKTEVNASQVEVIVAPPALHLQLTKELIQKNISVSAQNVSLTGFGAYTGEIAAEQLLDFGLTWTLTGHSERRAYYGETDEIVAKKTKRALDLGLKVIFCIGETLEQRKAGQTLEVLKRQTQALATIISEKDWDRVVIAYEPVWAIGTGVVATPAQAQEAHKNLREWIAAQVSAVVAPKVRIIYGGSVNGANCAELIALEDVDGFLVGGASLKPEFNTIIKSALSQRPSSMEPPRAKSKKKEKKVRINMTLCKYEVVRKIARDRGWHMVTDENDKAGIASCNIHWIDVPDFLNTFKILLPYQKVNHFPGMSNLARKSKLARNFERMKKLFPDEFDFCPKTWILPFDFHDFQTYFNADGVSQKTFIIKPDHSCQGRGVFLTKNLSQINRSDVLVAQQYIARPLLIAGKKFDLRIYVTVTSCTPLRVYLFKDGLVRMCTADYVTPNADNMEQRFMHLTNYAVNKHANNFEVNKNATEDGNGSKRSLRWFFSWLKESYEEQRVDALWEKIGDICLKSILAVQPLLAQEYRSTFAKNLRKTVCVSASPGGPSPQQLYGPDANRPATANELSTNSSNGSSSSCAVSASPPSSSFSILGMDVLVDESLKPWLLEVNHLPSFGCDSPLDWNIKERLISQTFDILNISADDKDRYDAEQARSTQMRLYGGTPLSSNNDNQLPDIHSSCTTTKQLQEQPEQEFALESSPKKQDRLGTKEYRILSVDDLRFALTGYYKEFNPERLKDLDKIATKYVGMQEELNRNLLQKYGKTIGDFASPLSTGGPETSAIQQALDENEENLVDYILLYPAMPPDLMAHCKYKKMLDASQHHMNEQQMRFSAPLQHRKGNNDDGGGFSGGTLPPLRGAHRAPPIEKKPIAVPGPMQIAAAHRMMMGHSSQKLSIKPPTPPEQLPRAKKEQINYGLQYRERLTTLKHKPTVAMSQISFGCFD